MAGLHRGRWTEPAYKAVWANASAREKVDHVDGDDRPAALLADQRLGRRLRRCCRRAGRMSVPRVSRPSSRCRSGTVDRDIATLIWPGCRSSPIGRRAGGCWLLDGYRYPRCVGSRATRRRRCGARRARGGGRLGLADALAAAQQKIRVTAGVSAPPAEAGGGGGAGGGASGGGWGGSDGSGFGACAGPSRPAGLVRSAASRCRGWDAGDGGARAAAGCGSGTGAAERDGDGGGGGGARGPRAAGWSAPLGLVNKAGTWYLVGAQGATAAAAGTAVGRRRGWAIAGLRATWLKGGRRREPGRRGCRGGGWGRADPDRGLTVFRVGRVTSAVVLPEAFDRPAGFELAAFWGRWSASFVTGRPRLDGAGDGRRRTRSRCSPRCSATADAAGPGRRRRPPTSAGSVRSALTFEHEAAAVQRLAGFGGRVEVLSPPGRAGAADRDGAGALLERYEV